MAGFSELRSTFLKQQVQSIANEKFYLNKLVVQTKKFLSKSSSENLSYSTKNSDTNLSVTKRESLFKINQSSGFKCDFVNCKKQYAQKYRLEIHKRSHVSVSYLNHYI